MSDVDSFSLPRCVKIALGQAQGFVTKQSLQVLKPPHPVTSPHSGGMGINIRLCDLFFVRHPCEPRNPVLYSKSLDPGFRLGDGAIGPWSLTRDLGIPHDYRS